MLLNQKIAKEIISALSPVIDFDINIININGEIIASTNSVREGTLHEGALKLIRDQLPIMIIDSDTMFPGSRMGVNLPIKYDNITIGVIGISGHPDNTINYGKILQKIVEMIIYDNFNTIRKTAKEASDLLLISDLIRGNIDYNTPSLKIHLEHINLKYNGPFISFIITVNHAQYEKDSKCSSSYFPKESEENSALLQNSTIKNFILEELSAHHILCSSTQEYYIAITNHSLESLRIILASLSESLYKYYNVHSAFFVGSQYHNCSDISKTYSEALMVYSQHYTQQTGFFEYSFNSLDLILQQLPKSYCNNLHSYVFKNYSEKEIAEVCSFIQLYFKHNGSINAIAKEAFIHKNTVQYRIEKIYERTGMNLRNSSDLFILYIASLN